MPTGILIVDDSEPLRRRIRALLEQEGFRVCGEAANGREAIDKSSELAPDLIILNLSMPILSGLEALPLILQRCPGVKVVIFTLDESIELEQHLFRLGAHGFVSKPAGPKALLKEVKAVLEQATSAD